MRKNNGNTIVEALIVLALIAAVAIAFIAGCRELQRKEDAETLRMNLADIRQALDSYKADHGWFPCAAEDWNADGDPAMLILQLTEFTDRRGAPSAWRTSEADGNISLRVDFPFGPYLTSWPTEPFSRKWEIDIDAEHRFVTPLADHIANTDARGGWYYEARSGTFCANLGRNFLPEYAHY